MKIEIEGTAAEFRRFIKDLLAADNHVLTQMATELEDQLESGADREYDFFHLGDAYAAVDRITGGKADG